MSFAWHRAPEPPAFSQRRWSDYTPWLVAAVGLHAAVVWAFAHWPLQVVRWQGDAPLRVTIVRAAPGGGAAAPLLSGVPAGERASSADAAPSVAAETEPRAKAILARNTERKLLRPQGRARKRVGRAVKQTEAEKDARPLIREEGRIPAAAAPDAGGESRATVANTGADVGPGGGGAGGLGGSGGRGEGSGGGVGGGVGIGDARAYCLRCPAPVYPVMARQRNWSGIVRVWLELAADGTVRTASVERSSGYEVLDREALAAARNSRFHLPAGLNLRTASGVIEYRFELTE